MDLREEVREFLTTRRARLSLEDSGLPDYGGVRRVPGLRRQEVAMLAGVSVEYYTRLERGNLAGVSEQVLDALAGALRLDAAEQEHLLNLARAASSRSTAGRTTTTAGRAARKPPAVSSVSPSIQRLLDSMVGVPAFVRNGRLDILAVNALGRALYSQLFDAGEAQPNLARFCFLDPRARESFPHWEASARTNVAILHIEAGRAPDDAVLMALVGELSTRSQEFRTLWARRDVRHHHAGFKSLHHPVVGELEIDFDALNLPERPGWVLTAYSARPGSESEDKLRLLASWAAAEVHTAT
ncbi:MULTISPECIES: helix-turn-helix transcriptional regulator [Arthrobacter]|uniref:Helix-turn-helix transcriptional regulator n=2 Tax=Arthrobacter TaxID=1663 RepID=A0ABU9KJ85_9MICC|nr:helix-turn-helix transcriptional regulator [Arthrobacter sp. YJM1]MDP5226358.1 helix-turn-helix transcriptional regulator [Arthrobacter sp. YJM1]